ncbi:GspE/PulE family protein [Candidatus Babeliales bacterium]|nr:GspE/PulE family protein [Candidatus Babeliales bacterium]
MKGKCEDQNLVYELLSQEEKFQKQINDDPIVSLVDSFLYEAIRQRASDIHLEQNQNDMRLRFRIDGILYDQDSIDFDKKLAIISRLKVLASLDIAEKRIPQDGKIRVKIKNQDPIDIRVSTFPSVYGEKVVLRILDCSNNIKKLDSLGLSVQDFNKLSDLIKRPYGFFLVTGPTGSGKSTTLYAILSILNNNERNIVTMEDPVEYNIEGITQSQVNPKISFTFDNGLRSILRQDPDVIMVGEIRDKQTAQIAIEAALTGHLVFSTLHTNDSVGSITRLIDMGIEPFLINAALSGVLAQRLCRVLCSKCKKEVCLNNQEKEFLKNKFDCNLKTNFVSVGCQDCFNLGYKGRTGIFELLVIDDNIRDLIKDFSNSVLIKKQAIKSGINLLFQDALQKVRDGIISLQEFLKIIGEF